MVSEGGVSMEVGNDAVAVITIYNPPANVLTIPIVESLTEMFGSAATRSDVKAIVLTGYGGRFSAGLDLSLFQKVHQTGDISILPDVSVGLIMNMIEDCRKPVVAAVSELALGVGLELAMGCHARISTPRTRLSMPELKYGLTPGCGGTQRLPRLIGVLKAVEMFLSYKSIMSEEGEKLGLIDAVVSSEVLLEASRTWALDIREGRKPWTRSLHKTDKISSLSEAHSILRIARQQAKLSAPNMPQHQACLDVIEEGIVHGGWNGILKEEKVFDDLALSDTSESLIHIFFAQRLASKVPNVTDVGLKPRHVKKVAVIGGGLMGSGIATALLLGNIFVLLKEINPEYLQKGTKAIEANIQGLVARRKLTHEQAEKSLSILIGVHDYSDFKDVDMVIEAVFESVPLKQTIFSEIEKICPAHCILATSTSTIDLNVIGENSRYQDRIIGAHFSSPAHIMPILEIIRTEKTSAQVILDLMSVGKTINKVPVVVRNCTGFALSRTFFPYAQSAHMLVNLGVDLFRIDRAIVNFGLPLGPFQLQDLSGYGVALAMAKEFANAFVGRTFHSPLVELMVKDGRNGKNNGRGYYIYEKGRKPKPDASVLQIVHECRKLTRIIPDGKPIHVTDQEIVEMILFPVVNEACRVLDERIVPRASDLDVASVYGMSFPSYRGGIVFWAEKVGAYRIFTSLKKWSELYGSFFMPSKFLEERAKKGIPLSASSPAAPESRL